MKSAWLAASAPRVSCRISFGNEKSHDNLMCLPINQWKWNAPLFQGCHAQKGFKRMAHRLVGLKISVLVCTGDIFSQNFLLPT